MFLGSSESYDEATERTLQSMFTNAMPGHEAVACVHSFLTRGLHMGALLMTACIAKHLEVPIIGVESLRHFFDSEEAPVSAEDRQTHDLIKKWLVKCLHRNRFCPENPGPVNAGHNVSMYITSDGDQDGTPLSDKDTMLRVKKTRLQASPARPAAPLFSLTCPTDAGRCAPRDRQADQGPLGAPALRDVPHGARAERVRQRHPRPDGPVAPGLPADAQRAHLRLQAPSAQAGPRRAPARHHGLARRLRAAAPVRPELHAVPPEQPGRSGLPVRARRPRAHGFPWGAGADGDVRGGPCVRAADVRVPGGRADPAPQDFEQRRPQHPARDHAALAAVRHPGQHLPGPELQPAHHPRGARGRAQAGPPVPLPAPRRRLELRERGAVHVHPGHRALRAGGRHALRRALPVRRSLLLRHPRAPGVGDSGDFRWFLGFPARENDRGRRSSTSS